VHGLKVIAPSTPADAKGLLKTAIRDNNPVLVFEHCQCYQMVGEVPDDPDFTIPLGKAEIKRKGNDITIVTHSYMVHMALQAAEIFEKEGISVEIVDLRSVKPMDIETIINSVKKQTGRFASRRPGSLAAWLPKSLPSLPIRRSTIWMLP
jgi:pyruvate dehydrogenase E1 component beta subunit